MYEDNTCLDLTEFFKNDDSQGFRLAEFLQKKGVGQRKNFVFLDSEIQRLSLKVQFEKIPSLQLEAGYKNKENEKEHIPNGVSTKSPENKSNTHKIGNALPLGLNTGFIFDKSDSLGVQPAASLSRSPKFPTTVTESVQPNNLLNDELSPRTYSQRRLSIRKTYDESSPNTRVRRSSLMRRLSNNRGSIQTESIVGDVDFRPPLFSTPFSGQQSNSSEKTQSLNGSHSDHTDTLLGDLQRKDDELKKYMEMDYDGQNKCTTNDPDENERNNQEFCKKDKSTSHQRASNLQAQTSTCKLNKAQQNSEFEVSNTSPQINESIVALSQNVKISEAKDGTKNSKVILGNSNALFSAPVSQSFNKSCHADFSNKYSIKDTTNQFEIQLPSLSKQITQLTSQSNDSECHQTSEDNLTNEKNLAPKASASQSVKESGERPLNLASESTNLRTRRLRKLPVLRSHLRTGNDNQISTETEIRPFPKDNGSRGISCEKIPQDMERMSNCEILDLRKRNSSVARCSDKFVKNQHQPDLDVASELLRRTVNEIIENVDVENLFDSPLHEDIENVSTNSSLLGKNSSGRVSFIKEQSRRPLKKNKHLPEVLKQYLEISKHLSQKKRQKGKNKASRSLYTPDENLSTETITSAENLESKQVTSQSISMLPKIAATQQHEIRTNETGKNSNDIAADLDAPAKEFVNESDAVFSNLATSSTSAPEKFINKTTTFINTKHNADNSEDHVFKKPLQPAPKKKIRKQREHATPLNDLLQPSNQSQQSSNDCDVSTVNTLRRSKRGRVPSENPLLMFQLEFQKTFSNRVQLGKKQKKTTNSKNNKINGKIWSAGQNTKQLLTVSKNVPVIGSSPHDVTIINKKVKKIEEPKASRKIKKRKVIIQANDNSLDCSRLILTTPPTTADYTNNRFDELHYNTNSTINMQPQILPPQKIKPLKVRVARLKCSTLKIGCNTANTVSSSTTVPFIASLPQVVTVINKEVNKIDESKAARKIKRRKVIIQSNDNNLDGSRLVLTIPPTTDNTNNVFDQLHCDRNSTTNTQLQILPPQNIKPFKVRVARLKSSTQKIGCDSVNTVSSSTTENKKEDLISWLKNVSESNLSTAGNNEIFKEIKLSPACSLTFTKLQGVEYGFYDTDDYAFLGYLRFQPLQKKPKRRSKLFNLHFISLAGNFQITVNGKGCQVGVGDLVIVEKLAHYDIKNITDDISILMVIKDTKQKEITN